MDAFEKKDRSGSTGTNLSSTTVESPPASLQEPPPPPNGGLVAWLQAVASFFVFFNTWGIINTFGAYQRIYQVSTLSDRSPSEISWIGSLQSFLTLNVLMFCGPYFDRGYGIHLMCLGVFLMVFGMFMTSLATAYWQIILAQGICVGIGFAAFMMPGVAILPTYFTTKKALASGIGSAGGSLGGIVYTELLSSLEQRLGLAWATRILAFIMLATCLLAISITRVRALPKEARSFWDPAAIRSTPFVFLTIGMLAGYAGVYIPFFYSVTYAVEVCGLDPASRLPAATLAVMNAGSILGRVAPGFIAQRYGALNLLIALTGAAAALQWAWLGVATRNGLFAWAFFYGVFSGSYVSLQFPAMANMTIKARGIALIGTWMGVCFFVCSTGILIGNPAAGAILRAHGSWMGVQLMGAAWMSLSVMLLGVARWLS